MTDKLELMSNGNKNTIGCCSHCALVDNDGVSCFCTHKDASDDAKTFVTYFNRCGGFKWAKGFGPEPTMGYFELLARSFALLHGGPLP
jgi:hypothetical protein